MVKRFLQSLFVSLSRLRVAFALLLSIGLLWLSTSSPVAASANNDSFDGNIFALYAGNGSIVPPKQTIAESIAQGRPSLLVLYLEDSKDCKLFASKVSRLQESYGRYTSIIPVNIDSLPLEGSGDPTDPATYNDQLVPKTVLFDRDGNLVLNVTGNVPFETIDDKFREIFDLLPRDKSVELIRREPLNEVNTELSQ
jgi:thiol-disulfide isomerase/thioredoxin